MFIKTLRTTVHLPIQSTESANTMHRICSRRRRQHSTNQHKSAKHNCPTCTSPTPTTHALHFRRTAHLLPQRTYSETARNDCPLRSMTQRSTARHNTHSFVCVAFRFSFYSLLFAHSSPPFFDPLRSPHRATAPSPRTDIARSTHSEAQRVNSFV